MQNSVKGDTLTTLTNTKMQIDINKVKVGDIFSEESHYKVASIDRDSVHLQHLEGDMQVSLSKDYVTHFLNTCDQYTETVEVTKEDKKDGTPGIRTIFDGIKSSEVFCVVFKKQDKTKTKKQVADEKAAQREHAIGLIETAKQQHKSMAEAYAIALSYIQDNPVQEVVEGEKRTLRGFKVQFNSRDGKYRCIDMDIERTETETGERLVNINTIESLVYQGVKYVVK